MIKVDKEGVPRIVQKVKYLFKEYIFKITLFNDEKYFIEPSTLIRYPPNFMEREISNEQLADAYIAAEKIGINYEWEHPLVPRINIIKEHSISRIEND